MSLQRRFVAFDEELGKKDDDHRSGSSSAVASPIATTFIWRGPRRKRILLALTLFSILYVFFKHLPQDALPATHRQGVRPPAAGSPPHALSSPKGPPPRSDSSVDSRHYFEGPIKYYHLSSSFGAGLGPVHDNKNVLFVVSNLKSVASLLPLACDMSKQNKNRVHLMLTGRDDMAIEDIEKINGVTEADCSVKWHDGRPDYSLYSTDYRMEVSVRASLGHINGVMKPRVVLIDNPEREPEFFSRAMKDKTRELGLPLIELPFNAAEHFQWISKLDGSSLKAWNDVNIEILIHSPPESSGSLIRLLKSLENADYFTFPHPRLTIELPDNIDPPTLQYLSTFRWPPHSYAGNSKLTLRHRLRSKQVDAIQASIRQVESFYPSNVPQSNILVLSPQVELSPLYFHYLVYTLLEYKYSNTAPDTSDNIMGISLEKPLTTLNNKDPLSLPEEASSGNPLFLYQSPNSNAALYFGDKWVELHSFISNRLAVDETLLPKPGSDAAYSISKNYPSWLSYILELSRARGYTMLCPTLQASQDGLATIHTELYQLPEEHTQPPPSTPSSSLDTPPLSLESPLTAPFPDPDPKPGAQHENYPLTPITNSILHLLNPSLSPSDLGGPGLPHLSDLPILSHTGEYLPQGVASLNHGAMLYAERFARELGGCGGSVEEMKKKKKKEGQRPKRRAGSAGDLFCLEEEEGEVEGVSGLVKMPGMGEDGGEQKDGGHEHVQVGTDGPSTR